MELAMNKVIGRHHAVQSFHFRRTRKTGDPGLIHQDGDEPLADPNTHSEGEFGMHAARTKGLPGGGVNFADQTSEPLPTHLRRQTAVGSCSCSSRNC